LNQRQAAAQNSSSKLSLAFQFKRWHILDMPKKRDENETAFDTLQEILRRDAERDGIIQPPKPEPQKDPVRVKAGRKGGKKGGAARAEKLSAAQRKKIAQKAARAHWKKKALAP
jgi:hypothetical protein